MQPPDHLPYFLLFYISFHINRYHSTLSEKKDFYQGFPLFKRFTETPPPLMAYNLLSMAKGFCQCSSISHYDFFLLRICDPHTPLVVQAPHVKGLGKLSKSHHFFIQNTFLFSHVCAFQRKYDSFPWTSWIRYVTVLFVILQPIQLRTNVMAVNHKLQPTNVVILNISCLLL